jgi:hypothetical protein
MGPALRGDEGVVGDVIYLLINQSKLNERTKQILIIDYTTMNQSNFNQSINQCVPLTYDRIALVRNYSTTTAGMGWHCFSFGFMGSSFMNRQAKVMHDNLVS